MTSPTNWQWPIYGLEGVERLERITESFMLSCRGLQVGSMEGSVMTVMGWSSMEDGGYHTMEILDWLSIETSMGFRLVIPHDWIPISQSQKRRWDLTLTKTGIESTKNDQRNWGFAPEKWDEMVSEMGFLWGKFGWRLLRQASQAMMSKGLKYGTESNEASGREPTVSCVARSLMKVLGPKIWGANVGPLFL